MAIKRYQPKVRVTEYEGMRIGVREARTSEMLEITKQRQAYLMTVKENKYNDGEGEIADFFELQRYVSGLLACDPDDGNNPWFADDVTDQQKLAASGVHKDLVGDVPHRFHAYVWEVFKDPFEFDRRKAGEVEQVEKDVPLVPSPSTTTNESASSSSESQSTSPSTLSESKTGIGVDSSSE